MKTDRRIAEFLLQSKAIKLSPATPYTWASGWKSPIYCDNRITLSYSKIRASIKEAFVDIIVNKFPGVEVIAGVATGAIAQGALVAEAMDLPFAYVRSAAKGHGMQNLIEGRVESGQKVVVIEDLISTGGSSLKAVEALREAGCEVMGMVAIFTYGFDRSTKAFQDHNLEVITLTNYEALLEQALEDGYIAAGELELLKEWRRDPAKWKGVLS